MQKTVEDYLRLPYTVEVIYDDSGQAPGYFARVVELPGCMTQADTFAELGEMLDDAMRLWIGSALEDGHPVPEPRPAEEYSGKFVVRLPRSLHRELAEAAAHDGSPKVRERAAELVGGRGGWGSRSSGGSMFRR